MLHLSDKRNIKEIAKLKGSEELWEVAKLHNCESSYPSVC
jgi:cell division control protein 7